MRKSELVPRWAPNVGWVRDGLVIALESKLNRPATHRRLMLALHRRWVRTASMDTSMNSFLRGCDPPYRSTSLASPRRPRVGGGMTDQLRKLWSKSAHKKRLDRFCSNPACHFPQ